MEPFFLHSVNPFKVELLILEVFFFANILYPISGKKHVQVVSTIVGGVGGNDLSFDSELFSVLLLPFLVYLSALPSTVWIWPAQGHKDEESVTIKLLLMLYFIFFYPNCTSHYALYVMNSSQKRRRRIRWILRIFI